MKTLEYYKSLKYPIELLETDEGTVVSHPDLPGCYSFGETVAEAIRNLDEVRNLWLEGQYKAHGEVPEPRDDEDYSGKFVLRVPKWLHRNLEKTAKREGVSLNQLVVSLLSKGVGDKYSEAVSWQLCRVLEQMSGKLAEYSGTQRVFVKNLPVAKPIQYLIQAFTKNSAAFEPRTCAGFLSPGTTSPADEEALDFVYPSLHSKFRYKVQISGAKR